jgi:predicted Zn-dependent protease
MLLGSPDYMKARNVLKYIGLEKEIEKKISEKINIPVENILLRGNKEYDDLEGSMGITKFKRHDGTLASFIFAHQDTPRYYESVPKKIAVILEHEATHFNYDHEKQSDQFKPAINALAAGVGSYWATRKINPSTLSTAKLFTKSLSHTAKLVGSVALQIIAYMQLSQYHERQADAIALQKTTDIDELNYFKDFLESAKVHHPASSSNSALQLFASHPTPASRIAKVDARIQELQALAEKSDK